MAFNAGAITTSLDFEFSASAKRTLAQYEQALKKAQTKVNSELGVTVDQKGFQKYQGELKKAKQDVDSELGAKVDETGFRKFKDKVDQADKETADAELGAKVDKRGFQQYERQTDGADRSNKRLGASSAAVGGALAGAAKSGALFAAFAGGAAVTAGVKFNATLEQQKLALAQLAGGTEQANDLLKFLYKTASETPFETNQIVDASRKFLAFGFSVDETKQRLVQLSDAAAATGQGAESIDRLVLAIGQIKAKGRLQGDELLQLTELGLVGRQDIAKRLGMNAQEFDKALRTGSISSSKAIEAIFTQLDSKFQGQAKKQSKTLTGQISTLKDNLNMALGTAFGSVSSGLSKSVLPAINKFVSSPGFQAGIKGIGNAVGAVFSLIGKVIKQIGPDLKKFGKEAGDQFKKLLDALKPAAPFLQNVLGPLLKGLVKGLLAGFIGVIKVIVPIVKVLAKVLGFLGEKAKPLRGIFEKVGEVIGFFLAGPIIFKALSFLGKLVKIFGAVGKAAAGFGRKVGAVVGDVVGFIGRMIGGYTRFQKKTASTFLNAARDVGGFVSRVGRWFKELPNTIVRAFAGLGGKIVRPFSSAFKTLRSAITKALGWIKGAFNDAIDWVRGAYDKLPGFVKKGLGAVSKGASAVGGLLGLSEGGKVGPASGGPQMFIAGEGGKDEWVISQEGDRRKNQMLLMEAAATIGLPMFKKGGKPKKKQSTKSLRNQVKSINNQQTRQQENIDLLGIQAQLDGTQTAGESMGINAAQARMLSLYAKERDRIRRLLAALDGDMGRVRGQIGSARGTRRDRLQEKYDAMREERAALRERLRELNSNIRLGNAQLQVDQNAATSQAATEQTDAASITQYDTAITMAKAQAALSGDNSGIVPLVKARLEELRNRLASAISQNNPALAAALTDAVTSAKSEYEGYLGDTGSGLGFTQQVSNLTSARMGLYQAAGNAFGGSMRTTNNKKVVNLTVNGLTQVSDPHLWARRVGAELALV